MVRLYDYALSWFPRALRYSPDAVQAEIFGECQFGDERLPCASGTPASVQVKDVRGK